MLVKKMNRLFIASLASTAVMFSLSACSGGSQGNSATMHAAKAPAAPATTKIADQASDKNANTANKNATEKSADKSVDALADKNSDISVPTKSAAEAKADAAAKAAGSSKPVASSSTSATAVVAAKPVAPTAATTSASAAPVAVKPTQAVLASKATVATQPAAKPAVQAAATKPAPAKVEAVAAKPADAAKAQVAAKPAIKPAAKPVVAAQTPAVKPAAVAKKVLDKKAVPAKAAKAVAVKKPVSKKLEGNQALVPQVGSPIQNFNPTGLKSSQIFSALNAADDSAQTGGISDVLDANGKNLVYGGASSEQIIQNMRLGEAHTAQVNPQQAAINAALAASVGNASVRRDANSNQIQVTLNSKDCSLVLAGSLKPVVQDSDLISAQLTSASDANVSALLTCLDANTDRCDIAKIDLSQKLPNGQTAQATLISRRSSSVVIAEGMANAANKKMWTTILNARMETSETINGASTYVVFLRSAALGANSPALIFSGELLKEDGELKTDARVIVSKKQASPLSDSLLEAKLIKNDGHGNLMFRLAIRNTATVTSEILLTVARR